MIRRSERFWQLVSAVAAIAGIIIAVTIFFATQRGGVKQLQAVVLSKTTLLNPEVGSARQNLRIIYQDKEVTDVSIIQIRIRNSGRQPIRSQEMEQPITIILGGIEEIISADIVSSQPPELSLTTSLRDDSIELSKTLLNPDDQFIVEIASIPQPNVESSVEKVTGRIAGVKQIDFQPSLSTSPPIKGLSLTLLLTLVGAMAVFLQRMIYWYIKKVIPFRERLQAITRTKSQKLK